MSRRLTKNEEARIATLLRTLGDGPFFEGPDVAAAVMRRVRALPAPSPWSAPLSFRQFAWGAVAAMFAVAMGALGLVAVLAPESLTSPSGLLQAFGRAAATVWVVLPGLARAALRGVSSASAHIPGTSSWIDGTMIFAGQAALVICATGLTLTVLILSRDVRARRISR